MSSKQLGLSEATKMPAGTSTLAFSQSLGEEKPRLLGFLGGLLRPVHFRSYSGMP